MLSIIFPRPRRNRRNLIEKGSAQTFRKFAIWTIHTHGIYHICFRSITVGSRARNILFVGLKSDRLSCKFTSILHLLFEGVLAWSRDIRNSLFVQKLLLTIFPIFHPDDNSLFTLLFFGVIGSRSRLGIYSSVHYSLACNTKN